MSVLCGAVYPPGGPGCAGAGWAQRQRLARVMQMPELLLPAGAAPQSRVYRAGVCSVQRDGLLLSAVICSCSNKAVHLTLYSGRGACNMLL